MNNTNKRGLGRGLEALLVNVGERPPQQTVEPEPPAPPKSLAPNPTLVQDAQALKELLLELEEIVSKL